jgi:hypothetical protein
MARKTKIKVPKRIMGTKVPKDIRKNLRRLIRSIEGHGMTSLVAVAAASWLMSKLQVGHSGAERSSAPAH